MTIGVFWAAFLHTSLSLFIIRLLRTDAQQAEKGEKKDHAKAKAKVGDGLVLDAFLDILWDFFPPPLSSFCSCLNVHFIPVNFSLHHLF